MTDTATNAAEIDPATESDLEQGHEKRGTDFGQLCQQVKQAGLLNRRPAYYAVKISVTLLLLAGGWVAFAFIGSSWYQLGVAAFLAIAFVQVAMLGHDAGHRQIFRTRKANDFLGILNGNLLVGLSYGWWLDKHNRHHSHPNQEGLDPDIASGAIAFTGEQASARRTRFTRGFARNQALLFFPLLLLEGLNLRVASVRALVQGVRCRSRKVEVGLLSFHVVAYFAALLIVLSPLQALAFFGVQQALFGFYMGCSFAPNHKGMPILSKDDKTDFLRRQVLTSRNIRGGPFVDTVLGGLNYQIEHHLFPSMPRPSLRRSQPLIRGYCEQLQISYREDGLIESYAETLRHLHTVGREAGQPVRAD